MKLNVPFYKSEKDTDCGPLALRMALGYLGEDHSFEEISKLEKQLDTGLVWSIGIARAAKKLGFQVKVLSTTNFNPEENNIEYYKKYADNKGMLILKEIHEENKALGIENIEKNMQLEELLTYVSNKSIPIVLINWNVVAGKEGFSGHFLPITGYDDENVYVHNPGIAKAMAYLPIKRNIFLKAWESKGTDKDTIVIYAKAS